eukprot:1941158-Amphidinium_carterae.1
MADGPLKKLADATAQVSPNACLVRSVRAFGARVEPAHAGALRKLLSLQPARQFPWNAAISATQYYLVRGLPASYSDVEVTSALHDGFAWPQIPLRRTRTTTAGSASWLVGAEAPPKLLHSWLGSHLVTIEVSTARQKPSRQARKHRREPASDYSTDQWHRWHADAADGCLTPDPWASARS